MTTKKLIIAFYILYYYDSVLALSNTSARNVLFMFIILLLKNIIWANAYYSCGKAITTKAASLVLLQKFTVWLQLFLVKLQNSACLLNTVILLSMDSSYLLLYMWSWIYLQITLVPHICGPNNREGHRNRVKTISSNPFDNYNKWPIYANCRVLSPPATPSFPAQEFKHPLHIYGRTAWVNWKKKRCHHHYGTH